MSKVIDLHEKWMKDSKYRATYFRQNLVSALANARHRAGLTQAALAGKMGTTQGAVARAEGGTMLPSVRTLARWAEATGTTLVVEFKEKE